MATLALYRKYRSQTFDELIGQEHVRRSLENAVRQGRISHAYLFSGPRGVGKTSAARILARAVNGLPDDTDITSHFDIIEIDAASNRRIDEIRDLREKVHIGPAQATYKVYIIDEVHMLTTEAFNALLKTLEEPPAHAIFILATTEPHKLPETIISRTQHFSFRPVTLDQVAAHLGEIAKKENLSISEGALKAIAQAGGGSVRDSLSILDQIASFGLESVSDTDIADILGQPDQQAVAQLMEALEAGDYQTILTSLSAFWTKGIDALQVIEQLINAYRTELQSQLGQDQKRAVRAAEIISKLVELPLQSPYLSVALETALLQAATVDTGPGETAQTVAAEPPLSRVPTASTPKKPPAKSPPKAEKTAEPAAEIIPFSENIWLKTLSQLKTRNNSLYALLRTATPVFEDGQLSVVFRFQFHCRRLEEERNRSLLEEMLQQTTGQFIPVSATVEKAQPKRTAPAKAKPAKPDSEVATILQVLGGEVING